VLEKYKPLVPYVGHRADLAYLIATVGGELSVGHSYLQGLGDLPAKILFRLAYSAQIRSREWPLSDHEDLHRRELESGVARAFESPGVQVSVGDYCLEVNGRPRSSLRQICTACSKVPQVGRL
jgi:tricorn protease